MSKTRIDLLAELKKDNHYPDILDCMAQLSPNEVPTPPKIVKEILNLLPQDLFQNPNIKFLDPCTKSAVFLREIAIRLNNGLKSKIPNEEERIKHIFTKQLYCLAITELTALISRRTLYCSKDASSKYSVYRFKDKDGNIAFSRIEHKWKNGSCELCGASQAQWDRGPELETHAYSFIHTNEKENNDLFERLKDMKFDVIIGNPPYQLAVGNEGGNSSKAKAIYHHFINQAIKLNPRYITMIIPSRWMTRSAEGISDDWIDTMLYSNKFKVIHDFEDATYCFPNIDIKGGVNYFLWDTNYDGKCDYYFHYKSDNNIKHRFEFLDYMNASIVIRNPKDYSIIKKIAEIEGDYYKERNFSDLVGAKDFFTNKLTLTSSWMGYKDKQDNEYNIKYYLNKNTHKLPFGWVKLQDISKHKETISMHKVYIPAAGGTGTDAQILGFPFYGEPNSVCSQTYLVIGYDPQKHKLNKQECENIIQYIKTKFFRYLVSIKKKTQNGPRGVYQFVPMQDFSKEWTDEELYKKYNLSNEEIDFIESMIKPME